MSIFLKKNINPQGVLGIWKIEENEDFFLDRLRLDTAELAYINGFKGHRKIEWLASRYLLHLLSEREKRGRLYKDQFGKPHLENSEYQISLSHTRNFVAVLAGPKKLGIDIQIHVEKISRIAHKFVSDEERSWLSPNDYLAYLHVIWGAKECIYKAYGRKELNFKKHIKIDPFKFSTTDEIKFSGILEKDDIVEQYELKFEFFDQYYLVNAIEK